MLLEEGFKVTSTDASDKMLKYAMKERWSRRKQQAFDNWGMYLWNMLDLDYGTFCVARKPAINGVDIGGWLHTEIRF